MGGMPMCYSSDARRLLRPLLQNKTDDEQLLAIK
jgi:hypothetical protein